MKVSGKNVVITGGSKGLGYALGAALAGEGAQVVLVARGREALDAAVEAIRLAGGRAHGIVADLGDEDAAYSIAGQAAALVGDVDLLVHAASTLGTTPMPLLLDTTFESFERVLQVNLLGPFRLSRAIAGGMAIRGDGLVVHVSSDAAVDAYPNWGAYGVSKAALDHLNRVWAAELADTGVRFLSVDPGEMDTEMHAAAMPEADPTTLPPPEDVAALLLDIIERDDFDNGARVSASAHDEEVAA